MTSPRTAAIWAQDRNRVLGDGNTMLWRVPDDTRFFQSSTSNAPVIMGRASYDAIGSALPNRLNIVMTRNPDFSAADATVVTSLEEALEVARDEAERTGSDTVWVAGGGEIYRQAMDVVDELVVSHLDFSVPEGDTPHVRAPQIDSAVWELDPQRSDPAWRPHSGDARWRVAIYRRK